MTENDDAGKLLFGMAKDTWGRALLLGSVVGGWLWIHKSRARFDQKVLAFACLWMILVVMVPTRVHERYLVLPLPFLVAAAWAGWRRLAWFLVPLAVTASFQLTSLAWLPMGAHHWSEIQRRVVKQYESLRLSLPAEEFSRLPPPEEQLKADRARYLADREKYGKVKTEWALTVVNLAAALGCVVVVLAHLRGAVPEPMPNQGGGEPMAGAG